MLQFIDTHIHLQDFKPDFAPQVIKNSAAEKFILISAQKGDDEKIISLIKKYPQKFIASFGTHPWYCQNPMPTDKLIARLKEFPKALIGEIGVDEIKEKVSSDQHNLFSLQLDIAKQYNRPVIIHAAKAFSALKKHENELKNIRYVYHSFVKNNELLKFIIKSNGYIGLGNMFLHQDKAKEMWELMPKNKILFETDAPYQIDEKNYNMIVQNNLQKLAAIADMPATDIAALLIKNTEEFLDF